MSLFQESLLNFPKRSLSNFFKKKSSLVNLCSFLTPKEKFLLLCNSKELLKEFDSKIDDVFMPREYQEKIKTYENYYEELFYQILMEMKRKAEEKGRKIKLYKFEENMVKYLKYLSKKFDKKIKISLIQIFYTPIFKLDFISKLVLALEKNIHLVVSMNLTHFSLNDYYNYYFKPSKAINTVEILDIKYKINDILMINSLKTIIDWSNIKKIIINSNQIDISKTELQKQIYCSKMYNNIFAPKLEELVFRCKYADISSLENFFYHCSKIKKLSMKNIQFKDANQIGDNSVLKHFDNITDLTLSTNLDNLDYLVNYFYPIFPKIKKFKLEIINDEEEKINNKMIFMKEKQRTQKNNDNYNYEYEQFASEYLNDDFIGESKDLAAKKFSFTTLNLEQNKKLNKKKFFYFSSDIKGNSDFDPNNLSNIKIISTLKNLNHCESLTYEIKEQKALINYNNNKINELIDILDNNKTHLKYLDINIYNDNDIVISTHLFSDLIQKISECKELNTFILRFDLMDEYAKIFNTYFKLNDNLTKINLVHNTDLDIMAIINEYPKLERINLELIMNEPDYTKENYAKYSFDLAEANRQWKEIELTNYPITSKTVEFFRNNKDISISLNVCVNLTDMNDLSFKEAMKSFIN